MLRALTALVLLAGLAACETTTADVPPAAGTTAAGAENMARSAVAEFTMMEPFEAIQ